MEQTPSAKDAVVYRWVVLVLRLGAFAGFGTMLVERVWWFAAGTHGDALTLKSLSLNMLLPRLMALDPVALLNLGVLLLLVTSAAALLSQVGTYTALLCAMICSRR